MLVAILEFGRRVTSEAEKLWLTGEVSDLGARSLLSSNSSTSSSDGCSSDCWTLGDSASERMNEKRIFVSRCL
jgi:hypothetical protein